jgi:hypothetical protein
MFSFRMSSQVLAFRHTHKLFTYDAYNATFILNKTQLYLSLSLSGNTLFSSSNLRFFVLLLPTVDFI